MSTRGFVGIGTAEQFNGRYNHFDSYPTGLGPEVWATVQQFLHDGQHLRGFAKLLLSYTDWRQMTTSGICEYCGQRSGQPRSSTSLIFGSTDADSLPTLAALIEAKRALASQHEWPLHQRRRIPEDAALEWSIIENRRRTGYPDPEAKYHGHDADNPKDSAITPENVDWLFMEWAYIIDPDRQMLHVMVGCIETPITYTVNIIRANGSQERWTNKKRYTGAVVGSYDLTASEPDWRRVQITGEFLVGTLEFQFESDPQHPLLNAVRALPRLEFRDQHVSASS